METQKQERGVKKVTKIIALASILSLILTYSSLISSLQQRLHLLSMYSNLMDKKYIFLLCNGIVGFIVGNFRENAINTTVEEKKQAMRASEARKAVAVLGEMSAYKEEKREEEKEERVTLSRGEKSDSKEEEKVALLRGGEEEVALLVEEDDILLVQDLTITNYGDDDEINVSLLSSEELNKKCEDFIKKMKEKIRLESRKLITS